VVDEWMMWGFWEVWMDVDGYGVVRSGRVSTRKERMGGSEYGCLRAEISYPF
jgi:hypothetical protein